MHVPSEVILCAFGALVAVLLRICTTLHPHSGQHNPPMFGDYEAQRHWMEITVNLPVQEWYHNTSRNDLQFWGLDYPPLTAYHMYVCGWIARLIDENYVTLNESRGYESDEHKLFMRYTVLIVDALLYIPSVILYFISTKRLYKSGHFDNDDATKRKKCRKRDVEKGHDLKMTTSLAIILGLLYPGIILIDHGHFQYNCVSLSLLIVAVLFLLLKYDVLASVLFCFALNYKQMELYHALPFFLYLLSTCVPKPGKSMLSGVFKLLQLAATVVFVFVIIWLPFLFSFHDAAQVLHRLFPIARGVFEDKVANVWCMLNVFYKFKKRFCNAEMMRVCLFATLTAVFPSSVDLFLRPNLRKFVPALINSSLAFFLFSFQVHEKSILLAAIPVVLYLPHKPIPCFWFLVVSTFSMLPLFIKDNLIVAFVALMGFYITTFLVCFEYAVKISRLGDDLIDYHRNLFRDLMDVKHDSVEDLFRQTWDNLPIIKTLLLHLSIVISFIGFIILTVLMLVFEPPDAYPDLFPLLISVYSCLHFLVFFIYFNAVQIRIPQRFEDARYVKMKAA